MPKVAGDQCHLLDCGPGNITAGITNSIRIEYDQNYGYREDAWKQYFIGPSSSAGAAGKRYYYHNRAWVNDADHICIDMLSLPQSQAAASLIALSGGNTMSGDRLLTLDPDKTYLFYDFWKEQFLGEVSRDLCVDVDPGNVTLLSFHEKKGVPQFISTTRHIMQGAVEIEDISFDTESNVLSGVSVAPKGSSHSVIVYIPDTFQWSPKQGKLYDDFENFTVKKVDNNILRVYLQFDKATKINWKVGFEKTK